MKCRIFQIALFLGSPFLALSGLAAEEDLSYFVFEGVVEQVDAGLEDQVKPGWTFAGSLEADSPVLAEAPVSFEYTLDERHIVEWFGTGLSEPPAERFFGEAQNAEDENWVYVRIPVEHEAALSAETFPGWVEFWLRADENGGLPDRGNDAGYFRLHIWLSEWGAYRNVDGSLWTFSLGSFDDDPEAQIALLEGLVAELRTEVTATTAERDVLRGRVEFLAGRLEGLGQTIDYILVEKQMLEAQLKGYEAAGSNPDPDLAVAALTEQLAKVDAERTLLSAENERLTDEATGLAEALAASEVDKLRMQAELEMLRWRAEQPATSLTTIRQDPVSAPAGEAKQIRDEAGSVASIEGRASATKQPPETLISSGQNHEPPRSRVHRGSRRR